MGLDNGIIFKIECPSLNIETEYEVCYFRKYWGLREKIIGLLNSNNGYVYPLMDNDILRIYNLLIHYSDIDNVREDELSTIWNNITETNHIRNEASKFRFIIDFIYNKINIPEFMDALRLCENNWRIINHDGVIEKIESWFEQNEEPPSDLEYSFYFYDSY